VAATSETQRSVTVAAGQAMLASWEGTAFQVSYVLGQTAGILVGLVMLRSDRFGRAIPYTLMVGNVVGFGLYLPTVGLALSAFSGLVLWAWYLLIARRFFQLERSHPVPGIDR
jgi:MFS family permease